IAQVSETVRFECQQEQKKLEELFKRAKCEPWRNKYRLRADISRSTWENGDTGNLARHGPYDFPVFQFEEEVSITGNVALLEVARSDPALGLKQFCHNIKPGERWWVVDFFNADIMGHPNSGLKSQHEAVRMLFSAETQKAEASNTQHIFKEKPHVLIAAETVMKTAGVADAFRALTRLPEMWKTKSFQYLTDVRKCWCNEDTLRKRVCKALGEEFDNTSFLLNLRIDTAARKEIVERCYQYAFLHAIRTAPSKGSVTKAQLSDLVKRELRHLDVQRGPTRLPMAAACAEPIAIRPSSDVAVLESEPFEVHKGHGISLFKSSEATEHLYYDRIHSTPSLEVPLTQADMVSHIVRIFLLGQTTYDGAQTPYSSRSPASAQWRAFLTRDCLPFHGSSSNSLCISPSTDATSSPLPYLYTKRALGPKKGDLNRYRPQIQASPAGPSPETCSVIISPVGTQRSRATSMSTTSSTKRPLSATATRARQTDFGSSDPAVKRPCLREPADERYSGTTPSAAQLRLLTDPTTLDTRRHGVYKLGDLEASETAQDSICAASPMSSSSYSPGTCIISNMDPVKPPLGNRDPFNDFALDTPNPFRQTDSPPVSSSRGLQAQSMGYSSDLLVEQDTATPVRWLGIPSTENSSGVGVRFTNLKRGTGYEFPATKIMIERFFANQKDLDEYSKFQYQHLGRPCIASDAPQLKTAILSRGARDIFVWSLRLASTDVSMPDN
ncbi:hypothetical protein TW65_09338, partial [Stemphylium lycopersici]